MLLVRDNEPPILQRAAITAVLALAPVEDTRIPLRAEEHLKFGCFPPRSPEAVGNDGYVPPPRSHRVATEQFASTGEGSPTRPYNDHHLQGTGTIPPGRWHFPPSFHTSLCLLIRHTNFLLPLGASPFPLIFGLVLSSPSPMQPSSPSRCGGSYPPVLAPTS